MASPVSADAPAKINLALHVVGKRADGYHLLESLVVFARYGDRLSLAAAAQDQFRISGPFAHNLDPASDNSIIKARDLLRGLPEAAGKAGPVAIHLEKNLPVASGIGGGSSDAAATLKALNDLWGLGLDEQRLAEISLPLGADTPMCVIAKPLVARGVGEQITLIDNMPELPIVLVNPGVSVSTPDVFKSLRCPEYGPLPALPARLDVASLAAWLETSSNDLQPPAVRLVPAIGTALTSLKSSGAAFARMSGSGATCFGLYARSEQAMRAAMQIRDLHPDWFVVATTTMS